jgi:two-component system LytT family response regulator
MDDLRVLVVDDEAPARKRLTDLIAKTTGVTLLAACGDGRDAIEHVLRDDPDLVFLDVQMPEIDGIEVVRLVGPDRMPAVVFVTAYDQYALKAFELAAVDYLLKPFSDDRFAQAVERAREQIRHRSFEELSEQMMGVLRSAGRVERSGSDASRLQKSTETDESEVPSASGEASLIERIAVQRRNEIELVPVEDVLYFEAEGSYVNVHTDGRTHLIRERMKVLEERLPPEQFCRIHRSTIVNLARVEALEPTDPGDIVARLTTGKRLRVSRSRRKELEKRLGL